jgi:hypothetical protein
LSLAHFACNFKRALAVPGIDKLMAALKKGQNGRSLQLELSDRRPPSPVLLDLMPRVIRRTDQFTKAGPPVRVSLRHIFHTASSGGHFNLSCAIQSACTAASSGLDSRRNTFGFFAEA